MRIWIQGNSKAVGQLRGYLLSQGLCLSDRSPHCTIYLEEDSALARENYFIVDGVDSLLEKRVTEHIHQLLKKNFLFARVGGIRSDRELRIQFAPADGDAVAQGAFRGLLDVLMPRGYPESAQPAAKGPEVSTAGKLPWWRRIWKF